MDFYRGAGMSVSCLSQQFHRRLGCPGRRKLAFQYHLSGRRDRKAGKVTIGYFYGLAANPASETIV